MEDDVKLAEKLNSLLPHFNEDQKRIYLASEAKYLGRGGKARIQRLTGTSHNTINRGLKELSTGTAQKPSERIRKEGGGRKKAITPAIWSNTENFIEPHKRGEPESPL